MYPGIIKELLNIKIKLFLIQIYYMLYTHALLKNIEDKPPGMKLFYEALSDVNISEYLIANKMGKLIIAGRGDQLSGKPSGKVDKK